MQFDRSDPLECRPAHPDRGCAAVTTREQTLDLIWSRTHPDFRGIAGAINPDAWPADHLGKRTVLAFVPRVGTVLKLLDHLTDDEIADKLALLQRK